MSAVIPFRSAHTHVVELPLWAKPEDEFKEFVATDDSLSEYGVPVGAEFLVYKGHEWSGYVHVVRINNRPLLGVVDVLSGNRIQFKPWHSGEEARVYGRGEVKIEGVMVTYARGRGLPCWEVKPPRLKPGKT